MCILHADILLGLGCRQFFCDNLFHHLVWFGVFQAYLIYSSSVAAGAQSGIEECKYQFAWDRWNCPERALQLSTHSGLRSGENYDLC